MKTLNQSLICSYLTLMIFMVTAQAVNAQSGGKSTLRRMPQYHVVMSPQPFSARIVETDSLKFQVIFSNPGRERVSIEAYAENGNCLYSADFYDEQYNKYLNFNNIGDGIYLLRISNGKEVVDQRFRISTNMVKKKYVF